MKKTASYLLIICMLASVLVGCVPSQGETAAQSETAGNTTVAETTGGDVDISGEYPVGKITLFGLDISLFTVVLGENATETEKTAASELCSYIQKACGAELLITTGGGEHEIAVGVTGCDTDKVINERSKLGDEGYLLLCDGGRLYITGGAERGTIYGVYSFLEDYIGCRYYARDYEIIKTSAAVEIPPDLNVSFTPAFEFRNPYWRVAAPGDFCAKHKINGYIGHFISDSYGAGIVYAGSHVHTMSQLAETDSMPCLSQESVYETVLKNVRKTLDETPNANIISVSQNDGGYACTCKDCKATNEKYGSHMATVLLFVNRIANEIADEYPGVMVDTLAYQYTQSPPIGIVPADNVIIRLCTVDCCFCHTFDTCTAEKSQEFMQDLAGWSEICDNLYIWNYDTNFSRYHSPYPNFKVLWGDVRTMLENNVKGIFVEGNGDTRFTGEFSEMRAYLMAKLLWDPNMTEERFYGYMDDFLQGYYGEGWTYVREYIDKTCDLMGNYINQGLPDSKVKYAHMGIYVDIKNVFPGCTVKDLTFYNEMVTLWEKAAKLAEGDELIAMHVDRSSVQLEYYYQCLMGERMKDQPRVQALYDRFVLYELGWTYPGCELPTLRRAKESISW